MALRKKYRSSRTNADVPAMLDFVCRNVPNLQKPELEHVAGLVINQTSDDGTYKVSPKGTLVSLNALTPQLLIDIYDYIHAVIY